MNYTYITAEQLVPGDVILTDGKAPARVAQPPVAADGPRTGMLWVHLTAPDGIPWSEPIEVPKTWPLAFVSLMLERPTPARVITDQVDVHAAMHGVQRHAEPCRWPLADSSCGLLADAVYVSDLATGSEVTGDQVFRIYVTMLARCGGMDRLRTFRQAVARRVATAQPDAHAKRVEWARATADAD
jgi:hypothetical protein